MLVLNTGMEQIEKMSFDAESFATPIRNGDSTRTSMMSQLSSPLGEAEKK
jgi:hypothetical protein